MTSESVAEALIAVLRETAQVKDLIGMRIFPGEIPQKLVGNASLYPCVVYHEIDGVSDKHLSGLTGYSEDRLQFDCHAKTAKQASEVRQVLRLTLQPLRRTVNGMTIHNVEADGKGSDTTPAQDGSDDRIQIKRIDFMVQHSEPTALGV